MLYHYPVLRKVAIYQALTLCDFNLFDPQLADEPWSSQV